MPYEEKPGSSQTIFSGGVYDGSPNAQDQVLANLASESVAQAILSATASAESAAGSATSAVLSDASADDSAASALDSAASAAQALISETNAGLSATAAAGSASAAATSATNANNSAIAAAGSATAANTSAINAGNSATAANTSAANALVSENNADISEANALASANAAAATLANAVTLNTTQTISGQKTFTAKTTTFRDGTFREPSNTATAADNMSLIVRSDNRNSTVVVDAAANSLSAIARNSAGAEVARDEYNNSTNVWRWVTAAVERMRLVAGRLLLGTTTDDGSSRLQILGNVDVKAGTAPRFRGDYSNVTEDNKLSFQTNVLNENTFVTAMANGTGNQSFYRALPYSTIVSNAGSFGQFGASQTEVRIEAGVLPGGGSFIPIRLYAGGINGFTLATDGTPQMTNINAGHIGGFRNKLINGCFDIWERGLSFLNPSSVYTADRWFTAVGNGTLYRASVPNTAAALPRYFLGCTFSDAVNTFTIVQALEDRDVRPLKGRQVTFSVTMFSDTAQAANNMQLRIDRINLPNQMAGATITTIGSANATIGTAQVRYSVTATVPADATAEGLRVALVSNSSFVNGSTLFVSSCQLEIGPIASQYEPKLVAVEEALCARYFQATEFSQFDNPTAGGQETRTTIVYRGAMRAPAAATMIANALINATVPVPSLVNGSKYKIDARMVSVAAGDASHDGFIVLSDAEIY